MKFEYKLTGIGSAEGEVEINEQKFEFDVSYLEDNLFGLLGVLVSMLPEYHYFIDVKDYEIDWLGEPWGYRWVFKKKRNKRLSVKVTYYDKLFEKNLAKGKALINTECDMDEFIKIVVRACEDILAEYGILGYTKTWHGTLQYFPITEFLILKDHIGEKKYYKVLREGDISYSDYKYEMNLLKSKTK